MANVQPHALLSFAPEGSLQCILGQLTKLGGVAPPSGIVVLDGIQIIQGLQATVNSHFSGVIYLALPSAKPLHSSTISGSQNLSFVSLLVTMPQFSNVLVNR